MPNVKIIGGDYMNFITWLTDFTTVFGNKFYENMIAEGRWHMWLGGLGVTLEISLFAVILGSFLGILLALAKLSKSKNILLRILRGFSNTYIDIIRGTPSFVQMLIINSVVFAAIDVDKIIVAIIAFSINSSAYIAEIFRAGILSIDKGQTEAGRSLGLNHAQTMLFIILPQAIKNILPALGNEFITLVKETSVAGNISARELTMVAFTIMSKTYDALWALIPLAVIYYIVVKILTIFLTMFETKLRQSDKR